MSVGLVVVQAPALTIVQQQSYIYFNAPTLVGGGGGTSVVLSPFYFTATEGQTVFTLPSVPSVGVILLAINGVAQSSVRGDFTLVGKNITLNTGVNNNDEVFGVYA